MSSFSEILKSNSLLNPVDVYFADFINGLSAKASDELFLAAAMASFALNSGNDTCLGLESIAGKKVSEFFPDTDPRRSEILSQLKFPSLEKLKGALINSGVCGKPGDYSPLILDEYDRLYLLRYFEYEKALAENLLQRTSPSAGEDSEVFHDPKKLSSMLEKLFSPAIEYPDMQKLAAFTAATGNLCLISGGPGTGKTSTAAGILILLTELSENPDPVIYLTAPTGKAAARLQQAVQFAVAALKKEFRGCLQDENSLRAQTLHRLLGARTDSPYFKFNRKRPLKADLIIVDEASMIPLALMSKFFEAIDPGTKVILLGDRDQLASVEAGAVFSDVCSASSVNRFSKDFMKLYTQISGEKLPENFTLDNPSGLKNCSVELKHSYRFGNKSGIAVLADAVKQGDPAKTLALLKNSASFEDMTSRRLPDIDKLHFELRQKIRTNYRLMFKAEQDITLMFKIFNGFRILSPLREGPYGIKYINALIETVLREDQLIKTRAPFYHGMPIMINRNDHSLGLYNGDTGIITENTDGRLTACFRNPDGTFRKISPSRLPGHETAYAMTVHKSQGSEFEDVLVILPDKDSPILTRELFYTAITRASRKLEIWCENKIASQTSLRRIKRFSGLKNRLGM